MGIRYFSVPHNGNDKWREPESVVIKTIMLMYAAYREERGRDNASSKELVMFDNVIIISTPILKRRVTVKSLPQNPLILTFSCWSPLRVEGACITTVPSEP